MRTSINPTRAAAWAGAALLALAVAGCSRSANRTEVSGTVTLDNRPLAGVVVVFLPRDEANDSRLVSQGTTDSAGRYTLEGPDGQPGAIVGPHRVVVRRPKPPPGAPPPGPPVPTKYNVPKLSPLAFDVHAGGPQTIDLPLTSD